MGPSDTSFLGKMRSMAEASFEQGCRGFENSSPARTRPWARSPRAATVRAGAGTPADVMRLHSEFVRAQMRSPAEPAAKIGQLRSQAAIGATKSKSLYFSISWLKFRDRNAHPVRVCYAASHLKLHCIAQN